MPLRLHPPGTRKNNRFWLIRGSINGCRPVEVSTNTTDEISARRIASELEAKLWKQGRRDQLPKAGFRAVALKRMEAFPPSKQDRTDIERLIGYFKDTQVNEITEGDIFIAAHKLRPNTSNANKNRRVVAPAVTIMHFAAREKLCEWVRYNKLEAPLPPPKPIPLTDAQKLIAAVDVLKPAESLQVHALLILLFLHGPRIGEALRLIWADDINMAERRWRKTVQKKRGKEPRRIWKAMSEELYLALANLPGDRIGKVFPWRDRWAVYRALTPVIEAAGVKFTPHVGRHTHAQTIRDNGGDDRAMQAMLDWQSPQMAGRYSTVSEGEQTKILTGLGEAFRGKRAK